MDEFELPARPTDEYLAHIGVLHKSGRYPWGSGEDPYQRATGFSNYVDALRKQGMSATDIAKALSIATPEHIADLKSQGLTDAQIERAITVKTPELRANIKIANNIIKKQDIATALKLQAKNMSNVAIGKQMGKPESTIRNLLNEDKQKRADQFDGTVQLLKNEVADKKYLDVGIGTEHYVGVSDTQLKIAIAALQEEGYKKFNLKQPQLGTGKDTNKIVLTPPGTTFPELLEHRDEVRTITTHTPDKGLTSVKLKEPVQVDPKRVDVRYGDEGGSDMDGVIELRRNVPDIDMGAAHYAQVRIQVGKDRYLKGMAIYADDLPDGVDIRFNTNKDKSALQEKVNAGKEPNIKSAALKTTETDDPTNPFGSTIRQRTYLDPKTGKEKLSALNIVNEEGKWNDWSSKLSSQFLSKQSPALAKEQLQVRQDMMQTEFDEINRLTNPVVKKKLLESFADSADSAAVNLKAAGLPRTKQHVILPINSLKDNEIYAPGYNDGERVVLVRHPHGGIFEIPELVVNNRNKDGKRLITNGAPDAVGINAKVAQRLSGADFDGDTVLVIPNDRGRVKTSPALMALKDFDPQEAYKGYDGMKVIAPQTKQLKMGDITNLITDMTIRGASQAELARAVKHSMVVIDSEKHKLNYKQSYKDQNIAELKTKYQGSPKAGAKTLISQASSRKDVPQRKQAPSDANTTRGIDKNTGELKFVDKEGIHYTDRNGKERTKTFRSTKAAETNDLRTLIEPGKGTPIEEVYADYGNSMKALANKARKVMVNTKPDKIEPSAKEVYKAEVGSLQVKLNKALRNAPLERQAQTIAGARVKATQLARPDMDTDDLKKVTSRALLEAREEVGAGKNLIKFEGREWEAVQAGAISTNVLEKILQHADLDQVKELATPRTNIVVTTAKLARAQSMLRSGYSQAEVAKALGISVSTLNSALKDA